MSRQRPFALCASVALASAPSVLAQDLDYTFDAATSRVVLDADVTLDFTGDLRGVYDAATNAAGTRTIAGVFGDPGTNARIPVDLALELDLFVGGMASGGFSLSYDEALEIGQVSDLALTLAPASGTAGADLTLVLEYSTFRTDAPASLFLGGFPLPLPLGGVDVTNVQVTQTAPVPARFAAVDGVAGSYGLQTLVPVEVTFDVALGGLLGGGTPTAVGPVPLALPLSATVDLADCGSALSAPLTSTPIDQMGPSPVPIALTDVPLDLPTILPVGGTANLLLDVAAQDYAVLGSFDTALSATALERFVDVCEGELNSTGQRATLEPLGTSSLLAGDFGVFVSGLPADEFGMLVMSRTTDSVPNLGGGLGTLCLGAPLYRFTDSIVSSGVLGEVAYFPDAGALPQAQAWAAGERWNFQWWYRDQDPAAMASTSNTSGALGVRFCR